MAQTVVVTPASQVATVEIVNRQLSVNVQNAVKTVDVTLETRGNINVDISRSVSQTGVQKIIAGDNITITPSSGIGEVTINTPTVSNVANANYANFANYSNFAGSAATVDGWVKLPFTFSDTSPKIIATIPAGAVVSQTQIIITTPFNDANARLSVGTVANPNELVSINDNRPNQLGTYTTIPGRIYLSETHVVLTIVPGASYTGDGMLIIYY